MKHGTRRRPAPLVARHTLAILCLMACLASPVLSAETPCPPDHVPLYVWDVLTRRFETRLIQTALANTRGRRIEAAHKLGIGRNTITRKIQELGME